MSDAHRAVNVLDLVVTAVVGAVREPLNELRAELARVRLELDALKSRAPWAGVWDTDTDYALHDMVTHEGALWLALKASHGERPGPSPAWKLIVKRGRAPA